MKQFLSICLLILPIIGFAQVQLGDDDVSLFKKEIIKMQEKMAALQEVVDGANAVDADHMSELLSDVETHLDKMNGRILLANINSLKDKMEDEEEIEENEYETDYDEPKYKGDLSAPKLIQKGLKSVDDFAFVLGWGINSMTNPDDVEIPHKIWGSSNWEVGFVKKRGLGTSGKTRIIYGLTLNTHYFKLDDVAIDAVDSEMGYEVSENLGLDKSRFGVRYLQVPLAFGFKTSRKTELVLGGHFGLRVKGYKKEKFTNDNGEDVELEANDNFGLSKFNYGADVSFGSSRMRLFGKYDFNPLFKDGPTYNVFTVGLRYGY